MSETLRIENLVNALRCLGCAVTVFQPEELGDLDATDVEDAMVNAGHAAIEELTR